MNSLSDVLIFLENSYQTILPGLYFVAGLGLASSVFGLAYVLHISAAERRFGISQEIQRDGVLENKIEE